MGIEPTSEAWEASVLPLNYARSDPPDSIQIRGIRTTALFTNREVSVPGCHDESPRLALATGQPVPRIITNPLFALNQGTCGFANEMLLCKARRKVRQLRD